MASSLSPLTKGDAVASGDGLLCWQPGGKGRFVLGDTAATSPSGTAAPRRGTPAAARLLPCPFCPCHTWPFGGLN